MITTTLFAAKVLLAFLAGLLSGLIVVIIILAIIVFSNRW